MPLATSWISTENCQASSLTDNSHATTSHTTSLMKTTSKQNNTNTKIHTRTHKHTHNQTKKQPKKETKPILALLLLTGINEIKQIFVCDYYLCAPVQYRTKGNFMLKIFFINSVFFIRVKHWSKDTFSNAELEKGLHIGSRFRVCLYDRLGTWTAKSDYFFLILTQANAPYAWPGQCLDHSIQVQVLSYPVKAKIFRVWLMHCPG